MKGCFKALVFGLLVATSTALAAHSAGHITLANRQPETGGPRSIDQHREADSTDAPDPAGQAERLVKSSRERQLKGDFYGAIAELYKALRLYEGAGDQDGMAEVYNAIGTIHHYDHNYKQARSFYERSLQIRQEQGLRKEVALLYGNIGSLLEEMGLPDSALVFHRNNLRIRLEEGDGQWLAICYANLGSCFSKLGQRDSALHYLTRSLALVRRTAGSRLTGDVLAMLGQAEVDMGAHANAVPHCEEALSLARGSSSLPVTEKCLNCLYQAYSALGRRSQALAALEELVAVRDSMFGKERAKGLLKVEMDYAYERQHFADSLVALEQERKAQFAYLQGLNKERDQKRMVILISLVVLALSVGLLSRLRFIQRSRNRIRAEMDRSEALLLNILPRPIADELKDRGRVQAKEVMGVSILFTDFHEFTRMSATMSAQELVETIDTCYRAFDGIAERHGLEKIKTIGDAYMCAGGLPEPHPDSVRNTVLAAMEMQRWVRGHSLQREQAGLPAFRMRAGIHTGGVVAGIVGRTKFQYDVWGDTVNIAARFVSAGAVDEVNVSEATRTGLGSDQGFRFIARGKIMAKGKGEMDMFFVRTQGHEVPVNRPQEQN